MKAEDAFKLDEIYVREYLSDLIDALDELDNEDYFGSQGWRYFIMQED